MGGGGRGGGCSPLSLSVSMGLLNISLPVKENKVTYQKDFHFIANINHTGTYRGHYTSFRIHCNDAIALRVDKNKVKNTYISYLFIYLVFRCDNTRYNPSFVTLYGKDAAASLVVRAHCLACPQL